MPNKRIKHGTANSLLGSAPLHILANYYQPLMRALYGTTSSSAFYILRAVFYKAVWWVTPQFSPELFGYIR